MERRTGTVKFFNSSKGYGFCLDRRGEELGGQEVFCHYSAIAGKGGFRSLAEGEEVEYEIVQGPKGFQATNLTGPGGRDVVGDPKARLAQPSPYLPFSSMSMLYEAMQPPYNMADPHRMYSNSPYPSNSPYTQQVIYVPSNPNSSAGLPSQYGYQPHQQGPPHAGSLGLQSPMIGQIGLGTPPMMSGMSSPIGAFYGGGGGGVPLPGGFGGIGSTRDLHYQQQAQQQQNNGDGYRSSPSNYFMTSPPGGRIAPLGPAPSFGGGFGSFPPSNSTNSFLPPNAQRDDHLSHAGSAGGTGSIGGNSSILNGSNGFNSYGAPRSNGSRSATPQEVRRSTPLGNGASFNAPTSPLHSSSTTNGTYSEAIPKRDMSGVMLGFESLSIES